MPRGGGRGLDTARMAKVGTPSSGWNIGRDEPMGYPDRPMNPISPPLPRTLQFGHSPDADDAFMFYGFHTGAAVIAGCQVVHVLEDIESLNRRGLDRADLEITAVSAHAYAKLADRYAVRRCGATVGLGCGRDGVA